MGEMVQTYTIEAKGLQYYFNNNVFSLKKCFNQLQRFNIHTCIHKKLQCRELLAFKPLLN